MEIRTHYSSSAGNLYQADDLLLEAGVSLRRIREALGYRLSSLSGCLLTHGHSDHAKGAPDLLKAGVDVYCSEGTAHSCGLGGHRLHVVKAGHQFGVGEWRVLPFDVRHDSPEPLGFLAAKGIEKLLFVTDTEYLPYRFQGITHILVSIDFDSEILARNALSGTLGSARAARTLRNHMSLQTALGFFRANDMSRVQGIWLLHLSDANSDAEMFRAEVERETGRPVIVAARC